jgi:p-cumate 2,3-dioxygenase alpha subunit
MQTVFGRCWLYLGHDSEIPKPGDFVTRRIAQREILFTRDRKGEPRAFFNSCTHRGVAVCRQKSGNRKNHTCPYHGWVYSSEGKLLNYGMAGGYGPEHNARGQYDLKRPARLDHYRGFFFINFNSGAVSLADYLADSRDIIDLVADQRARKKSSAECTSTSSRPTINIWPRTATTATTAFPPTKPTFASWSVA